MNNRKTAMCALVSMLILAGCASKKQNLTPDEIYSRKADSIIKLMTFEEKVGQLNLLTSDWDVTGPTMNSNYKSLIKEGKVGAIFNAFTVDYITGLQRIAVEDTRLGIPLLFGYDVVHGHRTIFPIPLAQAASWDLNLIQQSDRIAAIEASAEGINWTFAPMLDISRDPRWGRVAEGAGEDTYLGSQIAKVRVKGFQDSSLSADNTVLACVKHFAAYGAPQGGRDYNTVDMSDRSLFEYYLPPYKAAVEAGAGSVMTSFNEINGIPSSANHWLLTGLLHNQWGFNGLVVTDYTGVTELMKHGVAADSADAAQVAINAGVDMDMQSEAYLHNMKKLVESGKVSEATLNQSVKNVLIAKYRLGLFDDPYRYCNKEREKNEIMTPKARALARDFVAKSCVLLKNENQVLPIPAKVKSIAVIGPLANSKQDMLGNWSAAGRGEDCITVFEAVSEQAKALGINCNYLPGVQLNGDDRSGFDAAIRLAKQSDFVILTIGEFGWMSGEASSRTNIQIPGVQVELAQALIKTGKPVAVVLFNGRPLDLTNLDAIAPCILETWFGGTEAGHGISDILFGIKVPSGKITMTFPRNVGQVPIYYNMKNTGRPINPADPDYKFTSRYIDSKASPLYPFGYGLSYTTFEYSNLLLDKKEMDANGSIKIQVTVKNTGNYDGEEVVQLYIRDLVGSVTRPVKELKGFKKVFIPKGQSVHVEFTISPDDLRFYNQQMQFVFEPGKFQVWVGANSQDDRLNNYFEII